MRTPVTLFLIALVARLVVAAGFPDPAYPDSFYYVDVARQLAAGHGFNIDFIWIFAEVGGKIPANPVLPIPSNAHWMPLASLIQVPFIWVLGPTAIASALPFALIGSTAAPLAWLIARDAGARPLVCVGAGLLTAIPALTFVYMVQPDNFSLYQPLVAGSLFLAGRGLRGSPRAFVGAGLLAGLATLSRNDGVLVLGVLGLTWLWDRWRTRRGFNGEERRPARIPFVAAVGAVAAFAVCVAPWYARQLATFGTLSPSTASGKVLFIRDIGEWNSITTPANLEHLLGMGIGPLILTRIGGLVAAVEIFGILVGGAFLLLIPMLVGGWARRRDARFGPYLGYAAALFAFSALVSAVHVPGGTFIHSAVALAPHAYVLALEGIALIVAAVARRRPRWDVQGATRIFVSAGAAIGIIVGLIYAPGVHANWSEKKDRFAVIGRALADAGARPDDRVMSIDVSGTRYWTGYGGVVMVNDPVPTIGDVAAAYGVRWLVIETPEGVPAAREILAPETRPAWVGDPVFDEATVHVFPVCAAAGDARCARGTGSTGTDAAGPGG